MEFSFRQFSVFDLKPSAKYINEKRFEFTKYLIRVYEGIPIFSPIIIWTPDKGNTLIAPPVIEIRKEGNIVCDGMHRLFYCSQNNINSIWALCVENSPLPLAGEPMRWNDVQLIDYQSLMKDNFVNYNPLGLTGYSKFFNNYAFL